MLPRGVDVEKTGDSDVERAIAAFGVPSMPYRTFRAEPPAEGAAGISRSTGAEFPLLAAALPETADVPVPARPLPNVPAVPIVEPSSPAKAAEVPAWQTVTQQPAEPSAPTATVHDPPWHGNDRTAPPPEPAPRKTPLAAMFRMLRAEPVRRDQPPEPQPSRLQDLFRRL
jgi:hypothetical protein